MAIDFVVSLTLYSAEPLLYPAKSSGFTVNQSSKTYMSYHNYRNKIDTVKYIEELRNQVLTDTAPSNREPLDYKLAFDVPVCEFWRCSENGDSNLEP